MRKSMKIHPQNTKKYTRKILLLSLAVSLSGCAGSGLGTWKSNWNNSWNNNNRSNITGGVRNYGQYPMPNAVTCFINPTLVAAKQQGLYNLEFQKARQGISPITLVRDELIPATNQLFVKNNPQPLNALYAQIQPPTLANFMIGCNEVIVQERQQLVQERQQLVQERQQLIQDNKKLFHIKSELEQERATWQHYLNTTPAPQPTAETCNNNYFSKTVLRQADIDLVNLYESKPLLLAVRLALYIPYQLDLLEKFLDIRTFQGLQNFQQQLQKEHLLTDGTVPSVPPPPPPASPPINWEQYKITFTQVQNLKITTNETIQGLQKIHQQLQNLHQHHPHLTLAIMCSPSADIKFWESLPFHGTPGDLGIINYQRAIIAAQHGNWLPFVAIAQQIQPQTWRNYFVNLYTWGQKGHSKEIFTCD